MPEYQFTRSWVIEADNEAEARMLMDDEGVPPGDYEVTCLNTYRIIRFWKVYITLLFERAYPSFI